jgi:hypothetical protein
MVTGYEIRRYEGGVDGNGVCVAVFRVSRYSSRAVAYADCRRKWARLNDRAICGVCYSMYALYDSEQPAQARNSVVIPETGQTVQLGASPAQTYLGD